MYAKISIDDTEYVEGIEGASEKTSTLADKLKSGLANAAKIGAAALSATTTAAVALGKSAIENYAQYEQLAGGVETLFKDSADAVMGYAENAYKTAGLSANEYMETVTSFSASLLQSLGGDTEAAAQYADKAITDMSDNANKMGTSMESIQNAYQGFAKQNYTMLDNLKLGYGGTKEEMERLIADAEKIAGIDLDISSYADVVEAIHIIQDEMGITGTTAAEASETISGSIGAMKAAWENFLTGMADPNQDFDALLGNLVDSIVTVGENIIPRSTMMLPRLIEGVSSLVQAFIPVLPGLVNAVVPPLLTAGTSIIGQLVKTITTLFPTLLTLGIDLLSEMVTGIEDGIPDMLERIPAVIDGIIDFVTENLPAIIELGANLLISLTNGIIGAIPSLVESLPKLITSFVQFITTNLPKIINSGMQIITNLVVGLIKAIPEIAAAVPQLISAIIDGIVALSTTIHNVGSDVVQWIINGISAAWDGLVSWFNGIWDSLFGNRTANVTVNQTTSGGGKPGLPVINGSHASGLDYVPYDGYIAELHKGEMVVPAASARNMRQSDNTPITIIVQSVLDGNVIGETAYNFISDRDKAFGGAY